MGIRLIGAAVVVAVLLGAPAARAASDRAAESEAEEEPRKLGVRIGDFSLRDLRASEGVKLRLSFTLYAAVEAEHESDFLAILEERRHRVREQVITAVRLTETVELHEPSLKRLKRRILMRLRRTSPSLVIAELHFREFTLRFD